ncbi:AAA family ATPase [Deferribacterales bacterium RsTz2092]
MAFSFSNEIEPNTNIVPMGIVATKFRAATKIHDRTMNTLRSNSGKPMNNSGLRHPAVFETRFPESSKIAEAAEYQGYGTLRQKWGTGGQYDAFREFADEFLRMCEVI